MEQIGGENVGQRTSLRKVVTASLVGNAVEWYDFFLYGTAAALVFNELFFPEFDPLVGTLAAFSTFAVGFMARPVGGLIFGHYGDRIGRKAMLVITLLIMGIATTLIGLLPTYYAIGIWAPLLLVTMRILQGIGVGGEWSGAVLMVVEYAPGGRRGFFGSMTQSGISLGFVLSTAVFAAFSALPEEQFLSWGWRVPFLLSIVLVGVGMYIRLRLLETPAFEQVKESRAEARMPIIEAVTSQWKNVLITMGARLAENGSYYILAVFVLAYATEQLGLPRSTILIGILVASSLEIFTMVGFGALSDRIGRRPVYMGGAAFLVLFAFPFFWLVNTGETALVWLALVLGLAIGHGALIGPQPSFFSELFGTRHRYSGVALGHELASVIAGGFSPLIATGLLAWAGASWPIALYIILLGFLTFVSVYVASETFRVDISEEQRTTPSTEARPETT
jgi:MFS transporter, MHS family, shikimate and dehydroshikimate transport protein